jgi:hypothetical protein
MEQLYILVDVLSSFLAVFSLTVVFLCRPISRTTTINELAFQILRIYDEIFISVSLYLLREDIPVKWNGTGTCVTSCPN